MPGRFAIRLSPLGTLAEAGPVRLAARHAPPAGER